MKQQTAEKIVMAICIVAIILLIKKFANEQMHIDEMKRVHVDSLEKVALKVDSLKKIISFYEIQNPTWELELDANCKEFAKDLQNGFGRDSLTKVVIVGKANGDGSLKWLIKANQN